MLSIITVSTIVVLATSLSVSVIVGNLIHFGMKGDNNFTDYED
jgi:hypothetical protein